VWGSFLDWKHDQTTDQRFRCPSLSTLHYRTMDTQPREWTSVRFLFPTVCSGVDWQSARKAPVQLITVPANQYMVILRVLLNIHICCTTVVTILTTRFHIQKSCILPPCVCVCVCVFCMIHGINRNKDYFPKQHNPISLFKANPLFLCGTN